jgi:hypothetical protein
MIKLDVNGLTADQVTLSRFEYGSNELPQPEAESFWEKLVVWMLRILFKVLNNRIISKTLSLKFSAWP